MIDNSSEFFVRISLLYFFKIFKILRFFFFNVDHFKNFIEFVKYCFYFMSWYFGPEVCGILAPQPGVEPATPAL